MSSYHQIIISSYHIITLLNIISCQHHHQHHRRRGPRTIDGYFEKFFLQVFSEIVRAIGVLTFNLGGPWLRLGEGVWCNGPFLGAMSQWDAIAGCWCHGVLHCWMPLLGAMEAQIEMMFTASACMNGLKIIGIFCLEPCWDTETEKNCDFSALI